MVLLIGTRGSNLATTQSTHVMEGVRVAGFEAELHIVRTPGDDSQAAQTPVRSIGVGVFTETLRKALAGGECDIAVHSFKDLPTAADPRFKTVVPPRVDAREVLVSRGNKTLMELPEGAKVGTGAAQPARTWSCCRCAGTLTLGCAARRRIWTRWCSPALAWSAWGCWTRQLSPSIRLWSCPRPRRAR